MIEAVDTPAKSFMEIREDVIQTLKTCYDPEIPVDVYELGLIYEVNVDPGNNVSIVMTLTSPTCPVAESLPQDIKDKVAAMEGVNAVDIELTFDPPWDQDMMSEAAKLELGMY